MMRDHCKLSDLNDLMNHNNPHSLFAKDQKVLNDDSFLLDSPSSLKIDHLNNKPKLATIVESPSLYKSKSFTEIKMNDLGFDDMFIDDQFKAKSTDLKMVDDGEHSMRSGNMKDVDNFNLKSSKTEPNCRNLDKSFFGQDDFRSSPGDLLQNSNRQDDPFLIKTPTKFNKSRDKYLKSKELAVDVRNVCYQYGVGSDATKVLNDITVKVPLGGIYGLLGPSGCGKTSLLKIVCGMNWPQQGNVRVFGSSPGNKNNFIPGPGVGYMPQEISLFSELTVVETLVFYSKIYRMKSSHVLPRIEFLLKLLHLEQKGNRLIRQLSGGQKRRVSLAVALVHCPPLVILDEPTVGVDPLLRQQIWEYLVRLAKESALTAMITTHYIEEARQANSVGLMRFGRVLVESNPEKLMHKYKESNLEDVFLKICTLDQKELKTSDDSYSSNEDSDDDEGGSIKLDPEGVRYTATPRGSSGISEDKSSSTHKTADEVPKVVVSDYSLPLSPHVVKEKENENSNQGSVYANKIGDSQQQKQQQHKTPSQNAEKQLRSPLSPLNTEANDEKAIRNDFLQVKSGRDRTDTSSILGSSIIEYDSMTTRESYQTPVKLAIFKQEFKDTIEPKITLQNQFQSTILKIMALFYKNIVLLTRNIPLLLFQFLLPSLEIILFGICIGADPFDLPIAVYNQDTSGNLGQRFLASIDNYTVKQVHYPNLRLAIDAVQIGDAWGAIAFKQNFSTSLAERHLMGLNAENDTIKHSSIYVFLDMTNQLIGYKLQRTFYESFQKFSKEILIEQDANPASVDLPIKIGKPIYGDREPTFTEFMAPGVVLTIAFLATVALTALAFVLERKDGIMDRILVSGITPFEFLMSHIVTQLCVIVVQVALLLIFTFLVFDIPSRGPFIWVILLTMAQAICGMEYGLLISSFCESETAATMLALGSFYPNLLLSGTVWPTQAMPLYMRYFSYFLPQTIPIEAMRYILSRGWNPIDHPEVRLGFIVTIVWTIFFMIATLFAFRRINK